MDRAGSIEETVLLDNGLISVFEHSHRLNFAVTRELQRRSMSFKIFAAAKVDPAVAAGLPATPHFRRGLYDSEWRQSFWRRNWRLKRRGAYAAHENATYKALNRSFRNDLAALPANTWRPTNRVVIPAISQNQIGGLVDFLLERTKTADPRVIAQLMFAPDWLPWGVRAKHGPDFYRRAFRRAAPLVGRNLVFTAENAPIANLFKREYDIEVAILPIPLGLGRAAPRKGGRLRFGFFGYSKCDKGFHLLPAAILICRRMNLDAQFVIQINHTAWEPATIAADARLRTIGDLDILDGPLSDQDFSQALLGVDAILLPYDPVLFGRRGSGVFSQAASAGLPVVASAGTWAGEEIEAGRAAGATLASFDSEALAEGIKRVIDQYELLRAKAERVCSEIAAEHSSRSYVDIIIEPWRDLRADGSASSSF